MNNDHLKAGGERQRPSGPSWAAFADIRRQHLAQYREKAEEIRQAFGSVDGLLYRGGLETNAAEKALGYATGEPTRNVRPWGPIYVRAFSHKAVWGKSDEVNWAEASARAFLDISAEIGSSIHFTY